MSFYSRLKKDGAAEKFFVVLYDKMTTASSKVKSAAIGSGDQLHFGILKDSSPKVSRQSER